MKTPSRRTVMAAYGKYLDYAQAFAEIKRGEREGDLPAFARAVKSLEYDCKEKTDKFLGYEDE